ncbi:MAG: acyl--CoA ligase [Clostridia bacterium]|nr:acyl--CoA ligase [Clostridia bacterium]
MAFTNPNVFDKYTDAKTLEKIVDYASVAKMWQKSVEQYPNNLALSCERQLTYAQLDLEVALFRTVLVQSGVKKGDNVGILAPNSIEFVKAFLAVTTLGAVAVLLPAHLDQHTVYGCSLKFSLKSLIVSPALNSSVEFLSKQRPDFNIINAEQRADNSTPAAEVEGGAPCTVIFTGGTTGRSKGALLSNQAVMRGVKNGCYGYKEVFEQRYLLVLPLTHVFGLIRNLLTAFYTGSALHICRNPKDMFKEIAIFKPTILVLVPALAELALNLSKQFGKNMLGNDVKYVICGAAMVAPYLVKEYLNFGILLFPGYGLTESSNLVSGNPEAVNKPSSVGLIYPGMEYTVVDGELWLKGINMMDCYVGEPEENAIAYQDGWFKTGDLVKIDEEGFLYITGRKKEIIVLPSGENISPAEIENYFYEIDCIQDCLVYDSIENGASVLTIEVLPRLAVLKAKGIENADEYIKEEVQRVNKNLPSFMKINKIIIRTTDFIRSPSMKIVRNQNGTNKK